MSKHDDGSPDWARVAVPSVGALVATGDPWEPYRLVDVGGLASHALNSAISCRCK